MTIPLSDVALGGFSLSWEHVNGITADHYIEVQSDILVAKSSVLSKVRIKAITGGGGRVVDYHLILLADDTVVEDFIINYNYRQWQGHNFEIVYYHEFISVSIGGQWVHSFYPEYISYPIFTPRVWLNCDDADTGVISNVRLKELSDWREAMFVDLETSAMNAIASVIQQRPIEILGRYDGSICYQYVRNREWTDINALVIEHEIQDQPNMQICSDAIVYHTNVGLVLDATAFRRYGFITRIFRMPDLDSGAITAAMVLQQRNRQQARMHTIKIRFDPRLEVGDGVQDYQTLPGTDTPYAMSVISEGISLDHQVGDSHLQIKGRDA